MTWPLEQIGDPTNATATHHLVGLLGCREPWQDDFATRLAAIAALGWIGDPGAVDPIATTLESDPHAEVREAAARALGDIPGVTAACALAAGLRDPHPGVRWACAQGLARHTEARAVVPDLQDALATDDNDQVRRACEAAIRTITEVQHGLRAH